MQFQENTDSWEYKNGIAVQSSYLANGNVPDENNMFYENSGLLYPYLPMNNHNGFLMDAVKDPLNKDMIVFEARGRWSSDIKKLVKALHFKIVRVKHNPGNYCWGLEAVNIPVSDDTTIRSGTLRIKKWSVYPIEYPDSSSGSIVSKVLLESVLVFAPTEPFKGLFDEGNVDGKPDEIHFYSGVTNQERRNRNGLFLASWRWIPPVINPTMESND